MCGIVGVLNGEKTTAGISATCKFIEQAATVGVVRGMDSTGMFQIRKNGDTYVHKLAVEGSAYATTRKAQSLFRMVDESPVTVLHHRAATRGTINLENSHPFEHSDEGRYLIGVHNGSLYGTPSRYDGLDFDVDSDYALYRIFKDGNDAFRDLNGAFAFVWYQEDGKVRVVTNGERPFAFGFVKNKNLMLMASEDAMLHWLAARNGFELEDILRPEDLRLLTFDPDGDLRDFTDEKIPKAVYKYDNSYRGGSNNSSSNFTHAPTTAAPTSASGAKATENASASTGNLLLRGGVSNRPLAGEEVEFYPTISKSTKECLHGDVLLDRGIVMEDPIIIPAILSNPHINLYSNILDKTVNVVYAKVRGYTASMGGDDTGDVLMLENPLLTFSDDKYQDRESPYDDNISVKGPGAKPISLDTFRKLSSDGCGLCGMEIPLKDAINGNVGWSIPTNKPICIECTEELSGIKEVH